ncbi:MAG: class I adenylate-forming enzyme family protein [Candidatus Binatia bacterium]|nr:class I adenylate-forming enzyme family protein [Candidatus Binatia bacterium]
MRTLSQVIQKNASQQPEGLAFAAGSHRLSWAEYAGRSDALAGLLLDLGLAPGERVAVLLPDGPGVHVAFVATEKAGLVAVGIGPRAGRKEVEHLLRVTGATALISRPTYREFDMNGLAPALRATGTPLRHHVTIDGELEPGDTVTVDGAAAVLPDSAANDATLLRRIDERRLGEDDLWLINSTSGTTGMPKCVMHHQARWFFFHDLAVRSGDLSTHDVFLSAVPAPFGFGLWTAHFSPALLGAPTIVMPRFTAKDTLAAIEEHRVTVLAAVSTQFMMLLDSPEADRRDLSHLRALFTGGEKVPYARAAEFEERTGASVLQFYGSNETGALCGTTTRDSREKRLTTAGRVLEEMQVRLFDEAGNDITDEGRGQPGCKGGTLSLGYFDDKEANRELIRDDGWFLVGDIVCIDEEGYLTVEGRVGDFIIRGGKNISAPSVEEAVESHPNVRVAAAVAMPDPTFGERVCVYVELRSTTELTLEGLVSHLKAAGSSKESLPERLVVLEELPRSSGGKIAKKVLRDDAAKRAVDGPSPLR